MTKFKDVAHLYYGAPIIHNGKYPYQNSLVGHFLELIKKDDIDPLYKPILRPLSDMKSEEAEEFILMCMNSRHHMEKEDFAIADEIDFQIVQNDGGNLLDGDVVLYLDFTSRCFVGGIAFREDGSIELLDEDGKIERIDDFAFKIDYLLSKGFDLFELISNGEAIDKTKI